MPENDLAHVQEDTPHPQQEAKRRCALAVANFKAGKYEQAKCEFVIALKLWRNFPEALRGLGLTFLKLGDRERAARYCNVAADVCARMGRFDDARAYHAQCRKAGLPALNPFHSTARALLANGEVDKAVRACENALELSPEDENLACLYCRVLVRKGDKDSAGQFLAEFVRQHPKSIKAAQLARELPAPIKKPSSPTDLEAPFAEDLEAECACLELDPQAKEVSVSEPVRKNAARKQTPEKGPGCVQDPKQDFKEKRRSPRVPLADYQVRIGKRKSIPHPVVDVCRDGIGFKALEKNFQRGDTLVFDLLILEKPKIKKISAVVRHVTNGLVGCEFVKMSRKQSKILEEIIFAEHEEDDSFHVEEKVNFNIEMW